MTIRKMTKSALAVLQVSLLAILCLSAALTASGETDPYPAGRITVDTADAVGDWVAYGSSTTLTLETTDKKEGTAALKTSNTAGTIFGFQNRGGSMNVELPSDWRYNWDIEFWFYIDKPTNVSSMIFEFSEEVDAKECQYGSYSFVQGWQKITLTLGQATGASGNAEMTALKNIRLLITPTSAEAVTLMLDDIALVRRDEIRVASCDTLPAGWGNTAAATDGERGAVLESNWAAAGGGGPYCNTNMNIVYPAKNDWSNWSLDLWIYINDVSLINNGFIELSKTRDAVEMQWNGTQNYVQNGWNHVVLPFSTANGADGMDTLNTLRLYFDGKVGLVAKFDDIKLVHAERTNYTITFDSDGGTPVAPQELASGTTVTRPDDPTKAGLTFLGWYTGNRLWQFHAIPTQSLTLKARWHDPAANPDSILVDSCDSYEGWRVRLYPASPHLTQRPPLTAANLDTVNQVEGDGCLTLTYDGEPGLFGPLFVNAEDLNNIYAPHADGLYNSVYNIPLPDDWLTDWEFVFSLYIDDIANLDANANVQVEVSEAVDQKEVEWNNKLALSTGWNTVVIKFSNMRGSNAEEMTTLNHIRLHMTNIDDITIRLDNIHIRRTGSGGGDPDKNIDFTDDCSVKDTSKYYYKEFDSATENAMKDINVQIGDGPSQLTGSSAYLFNNLALRNGSVFMYGTNPGALQEAITLEEETVIEFWMYVDDIDKINNARIELSSSYSNDQEEREYQFRNQLKENGWNRIILPVSSGYSSSGVIDLNSIVRYRMFLGSGEDSGTVSLAMAGFRIGLAPDVIEYGSLDEQLLRAERREKTIDEYTKASGDAFLAVLAEARALRDNVGASQEDIDAMTEKLKTAINAMVLLGETETTQETDGTGDDGATTGDEQAADPVNTGLGFPAAVCIGAVLSAAGALRLRRRKAA